ncbi:ectoine hydroxylase [Endozoicomonas elysicola]|uniref:Ectoine hydroxylase n=1 Tax=Endozoicomonas elysicola TaxID=305900 RepID=A0A081KAA9_9GAMM|nr:ectoine hydroxylase [Endozoicomonas elysicola]KEI71085.1 ectoine hydroxylase [Endozoicomonas elysicola]
MQQQNDLYPSRINDKDDIIWRTDPVLHPSDIHPAEHLTEDLLQHYQEKGYMLIPDLFNEKEVIAFISELERMKQDSAILNSPQAITEMSSGDLRSVFQIHCNHPAFSPLFSKTARDSRITDVVRLILGGDIYIHQSRLNFKPGFRGKEFYWHSDFETWHVEDGMPAMGALSCSILLTDNNAHNGALMLIPGSHREYISCTGETPDNHYLSSLKKQEYGVPSDQSLSYLASKYGIDCAEAKAGSVLFFDCNVMHGSNSNITPCPRSNLFFAYNQINNRVGDPFCGKTPRPEYLCSRQTMTPI